MVFISPERWLAQPHAQSLLLFPIVFDINLIHFFDEKKDGAAGSLVLVLRSPVTPFDRSKTKNEKLKCKFLARKSAKLFANTKVQIFGKGKVQNSPPISAL